MKKSSHRYISNPITSRESLVSCQSSKTSSHGVRI
nr:MAG TPA: hypothetical protein [Inoviridae sp.]